MRRTLTAMVVAALLGSAGSAWGKEATLERCSDGTAERLQFIEERLELRRPYATWWWRGWTGFYGLGVVIQGVRGATEKDDSTQADLVVSASKAAIGVTRLLVWPIKAQHGGEPMRVVDPVDESACRERLRVGEELMREYAHESESRWDWKRHAGNVALNVAGALIVAEGWDDPSRGWRSAGIGIAVGEVFTFSQPWKADDDLVEYEQHFSPGAVPGVKPISFSVAPTLGGLQLRMSF